MTRVIIFSYQRPEMLLSILKHLHGKVDSVLVLDDKSTYDATEHKKYCEYRRNPVNCGKRYFYRQWQRAMDYCKKNPADIFIFMPDDFENINIQGITDIHSMMKSRPYAFNIINDGREACWTPRFRKREQTGKYPSYSVGFVDCGFFCNTTSLQRLLYFVEPVPDAWFDTPEKSSGVGRQLSQKFMKANVTMYQPVKSLAYHGDHESKMHPNERLTNKLISR